MNKRFYVILPGRMLAFGRVKKNHFKIRVVKPPNRFSRRPVIGIYQPFLFSYGIYASFQDIDDLPEMPINQTVARGGQPFHFFSHIEPLLKNQSYILKVVLKL